MRILLDNEEVLATVTQYTGTLAPLNYTTKPGGPPETTAYVPTEPHTQVTTQLDMHPIDKWLRLLLGIMIIEYGFNNYAVDR